MDSAFLNPFVNRNWNSSAPEACSKLGDAGSEARAFNPDSTLMNSQSACKADTLYHIL